MKIGGFENLMQDYQKGSCDYTKNGQCTGCGECCGNFLPLSAKEIRRIKALVKRKGIREQKQFIPTSMPLYDFTCPFLDAKRPKNKCTIYADRPAICKAFKCDEPNGALLHPELFKDDLIPVNMRETFFGGGE